MPGEPPREPKQEQADNRARGVNHHISYLSFPVWDEKLMDFITRRIHCYEQDSKSGISPAPRARVIANRFAQGTPKQECQHCVLGQVRAFANDKYDPIYALLR